MRTGLPLVPGTVSEEGVVQAATSLLRQTQYMPKLRRMSQHSPSSSAALASSGSRRSPSAVLGCSEEILDEDGEGPEENEKEEEAECSAPRCRRPIADQICWVQCDLCQEWFHCTCVGLTKESAEKIEKFNCRRCLDRAGQRRLGVAGGLAVGIARGQAGQDRVNVPRGQADQDLVGVARGQAGQGRVSVAGGLARQGHASVARGQAGPDLVVVSRSQAGQDRVGVARNNVMVRQANPPILARGVGATSLTATTSASTAVSTPSTVMSMSTSMLSAASSSPFTPSTQDLVKGLLQNPQLAAQLLSGMPLK